MVEMSGWAITSLNKHYKVAAENLKPANVRNDQPGNNAFLAQMECNLAQKQISNPKPRTPWQAALEAQGQSL